MGKIRKSEGKEKRKEVWEGKEKKMRREEGRKDGGEKGRRDDELGREGRNLHG